MTAAVAVCVAATFLFGVFRFPDGVQVCDESRHYVIKYHPEGYCGKQGQPHTATDYRAFEAWTWTMAIVWPVGM